MTIRKIKGFSDLHILALEEPSPRGMEQKDCNEMVLNLISKGADINAKSEPFCETPLHTAILVGNTEIAKILIEAGADTKCKTFLSGYNSLHYAVRFSRYDIVVLLIESGVDFDLKTDSGETALEMAISRHKHFRPGCVGLAHFCMFDTIEVLRHRNKYLI